MNPTMLEVRVASKKTAARDICAFELVSASGEALPSFTAGSHIDVHTPDGPIRQYSLCNDPRESSRYVIGVLRDPFSRGGSRSMHERLMQGDVLRIGAPRNLFGLVTGDHHSLLLAGGIGITPLLSMAEHLTATAGEYRLHYCTRGSDRTAFRGRLSDADLAKRVTYHFDDGDPSQKLDIQQVLSDQPDGTHLYVCGPSGFIDHVLKAAGAAGWPSQRLHHESFSGPLVEPGVIQGAAFDVVLARSSRVIRVGANETVAAALAAAGVKVPLSCEQGICGTCMTPVLSGEPDHRDMFMTDEEHARNDAFTPCCSRARSNTLVVDL